MDMKEILSAGIKEALERAIADGALPAGQYPDIVLEVPPKKELGDFATNIAMQAARVARKSPRDIGAAIVANMKYDWLDRAEIAGAGFINFFLKADLLHDTLMTILKAEGQYGTIPIREEDTIQVEYVSANPTGPLHVGHGRGAAYGSALVNLLHAAGYNVSAEYYINDAGNQVDNLALSVNARYLELLGKDCEFPENGYHGEDIKVTAQEVIDKDGDKYLALSEEERLAFFKEYALQAKLAHLRQTLSNFRVEFNEWFSERTLHASGSIKAACDKLLANGNMYEKDGALWLNSEKYGDDKDRVVIRDNGIPTYLAADIAYHDDKYNRGFKRLINIWGADHHGYVARIKASMAALGHNPDQLEVLLLQMVSLFRDGVSVKMSKRTGEAVTLDELLEEVGVDATRYFFLMRSLDSQLDFDIELAKTKSSDNPVYYIQYAHARIHSIYRQLAEAKVAMPAWDDVDFSTLQEEKEMELIKKLSAYSELVEKAARDRAPHRVATYLYEVASLFHSFYKQNRILGVDPELQKARMGLITAVRYIIAHGLAIMGISAPEQM